MQLFIEALLCTASDAVLFWLLQGLIAVAVVAAFALNKAAELRAGKGAATSSVGCGDESMSIFYGTYLALNGLLVAICLSVDVISKYRVFWVVVDTLAPAYICIFNPWSRNKLLAWAQYLRKIEER